jgi:hypothetical protein
MDMVSMQISDRDIVALPFREWGFVSMLIGDREIVSLSIRDR